MNQVPVGSAVAETAKLTRLTSKVSMMEAYQCPAMASKTTSGSLMPMPIGPPRTGRNQKSEREKVAFLTLPLVLYIVPARFTICTTNLSLAPRPWSGGLHLHGFGLVLGVLAICFCTWMKLFVGFGLVVLLEAPPALVFAVCNAAAFGKSSGRATVWRVLSTVGAGSAATFTVPMSSA